MPVFERYHAIGKEVIEAELTDEDVSKRHYADAVDDEAAIAIAYALNCVFLAKLGPVDLKKPCPTCKGVEVHASNCVERFDHAR